MRSSRSIVISAAVHLGLGAALLLVASARQAREATSVAVFSEKKKDPPKPKPPAPTPAPKPPPSRPAAAPVRETAAEASAPAPASAPGPVALDALELSSDDVAGAVVVPVERRAAPAPMKVASLTASPPPARERPGTARDAPCEEPPGRPEPTYRVEIEYVAQARAEGVEGRLVLRIHVAPDGTVANVEILSSVHPALDAAAVATVMQWRFRPALACGRPSPSVYTLARKFELGD